MYRFSGLDIELTRGDSVQFKVTVMGRELPEGSSAVFSVKKNPKDAACVLEKKLALAQDGVVLVGLSHEDTDIPAAMYWWDLRVLLPLGDGSFEVRTPMEYASFTIMEVIGNV